MATIPTIPTFADGPPALTAAQLNALGSGINFQINNRPLAKIRQGTAKTSVPNATWATLSFDTTDVDTDGGRSGTGSATDRYVSRTAGWYTVHASVCYQQNSVGDRQIRLLANGFAQYGVQTSLPTVNLPTSMNISKNVHLNVGDYLQVQAWQSSGGILTSEIAIEAESTVDIYFNLAG